MLVFVTTCHPAYPKAWLFPTLDKLGCGAYALLDPDDKRDLPANVRRIPFRSDRFYQDGRFLDALPDLDRDDVVILADADAVIQRDWSHAERALLENLGDAFAVGYNMKPGQTGLEELDILHFARPPAEVARALRLPLRILAETPMYNWGLVAAKVSTWRTLRMVYSAATRYLNPQDLFVHPTWMQYVLCVLLAHYQIPVVEFGYGTHSHTHFGFRPQHAHKFGKLYYGEELVFFAHNIPGLARAAGPQIQGRIEATTNPNSDVWRPLTRTA
jgi:hypothetical protein